MSLSYQAWLSLGSQPVVLLTIFNLSEPETPSEEKSSPGPDADVEKTIETENSANAEKSAETDTAADADTSADVKSTDDSHSASEDTNSETNSQHVELWYTPLPPSPTLSQFFLVLYDFKSWLAAVFHIVEGIR